MDNNVPDYMQSVYGDTPGPEDFQNARLPQQMAAHEFQRQCYAVFFDHDDGKKLYESLKQQFLIANRIDMSKPNADHAALYLEGMREVVRGLGEQAMIHKKRITEGG